MRCTGMNPGDVFGRLTLVQRFAGTRRMPAKWECLCSCGTRKLLSGDDISRGKTRSCGCLQRELLSARRKASTGKQPRVTDHDLYPVWRSMRHRCNNPKYREYDLYGGRGIQVCERWSSFANFAADMGTRPDGMSIDRIDSNGNYEPGNCRWASPKTQNNNRRNNALLTFRGQTQTMAQWADSLGINYFTLATRLVEGWSVEDALSRPIRSLSRKQHAEGATA